MVPSNYLTGRKQRLQCTSMTFRLQTLALQVYHAQTSVGLRKRTLHSPAKVWLSPSPSVLLSNLVQHRRTEPSLTCFYHDPPTHGQDGWQLLSLLPLTFPGDIIWSLCSNHCSPQNFVPKSVYGIEQYVIWHLLRSSIPQSEYFYHWESRRLRCSGGHYLRAKSQTRQYFEKPQTDLLFGFLTFFNCNP